MTKSPTQDNKDETISLRSLTQEITGVRQWTQQDVKNGMDAGAQELAFDAAYQELKRILDSLKTIAKLDRPIKPTRQNAGALKLVLRAMHFHGDLRPIYIKLRSDKPLKPMEYHRLLSLLAEALAEHRGLTEEKLLRLKEKIEWADYQNFIEHHVAPLSQAYANIEHIPDTATKVKKLAALQCSLCAEIENFQAQFEKLSLAKPNKVQFKTPSRQVDALELALQLLLENNMDE